MKGFRSLIVLGFLGSQALSWGIDVTAKSAISIDGASGKVLWSKAADAPMFPASTTKIMTGLLLVEHCRPDDIITAPEDIETVKESSMHLRPGEKISARDMLYAIMLRSANDGCYAIAKHISGSVQAFSKLMNERARQVGCTHTHFHNPNGLNDPEHITTAHDLALMARAAMKYKEFRDAVKTIKYEISRSINQHDRVMVNHDKLLRKDPFAEGIKTGFTVPAGHCFVGSSSKNGFRVITVVMKSQHWQKDDEDLMNWSFQHFEKKEKLGAGDLVGQVKLPFPGSKVLPVALADSAYTLGPIGENPQPATQEIVLTPNLQTPIKKGDRVGELVLKDADGWIQKIPVVAMAEIPKLNGITAVKTESMGSKAFWGGALLVGVFYMRDRVRKKIKYYGRSTTRQGS